MNNPFLNRLANILDGLPPYQLSHEASYCDAHYRDVETGMAIDAKPVLHDLDRFFMTGDARDSDFEPSWIPWKGDTCGNLEAWAALTAAREQDIPLPLSQEAVARIAAEALGLPEPPAGTVLLTSLSPILNPACLLGRCDAVTPQHAASVLRACADGQSPVEAWNHVSLNIRNQRLLELADIVQDLPSTDSDDYPAVDMFWTKDLRSQLSTLTLDPLSNVPILMKDGSWGGNLALWTLSRFGDYVENHLGEIYPNHARHAAGMVLGLTYLEATVLFYGSLAPDMDRFAATHEIYKTVMTRDAPSTSRNLKLLATGAMPPIEWDEIEDILGAT